MTAAELDPNKALLHAAVMRLGGDVRDGQQHMVAAVAEAIATHTNLLVQAGTGTGKSLGYLVPAAVFAVESADRVVVSTGTLALQRQLVTRDLPLVAEACKEVLGKAPSFAVLKGWRNYLCKYKLDGGYPREEQSLFEAATVGLGDGPSVEGPSPSGECASPSVEGPSPSGECASPSVECADRRVSRPRGRSVRAPDEPEGLVAQVRRVTRWASETTTGDRDDLVPGVSERAWNQVSVSTRECLGTKCPLLRECFAEAAQAKTREADIVVTNHTMLGIAASSHPVLPEHDVLIVDEAHELADRITSAATVELSSGNIETAARQARRHGKANTDELEAAARRLGSLLADAPAQYLPDGLSETLNSAVGAVRDAARKVLSTLKPTGDEVNAGLRLAQAGIQQIFDVADQISAADVSRNVLWVSRGGEGGLRGAGSRGGDQTSQLHCAPLRVSGLIGTELLHDVTGIFTSATLTLGGSFESAASSLGLWFPSQPKLSQRLARESLEGDCVTGVAEVAADLGADDATQRPEIGWQGVDVGSPFDYASQGILYVAAHLPAPGRDPATEAQLDEIATLITAAGGRTLGLFTSWRAAEAAASAMRERLDFPVLLQGDDRTPTLVAQFLADPRACLFGTRSLWQGVDMPGDSCQLVLIDRIPFPRPDDPVTAARSQAVQRTGGSGFMAVSVPQAALLLAQGAGRLIRTASDRGVVAILDPRLVTARYGKYLQRSMPDFWTSTNRDVVAEALRRLDVQAGEARVDAS